ncbi:hypothetical protein ACFQER_01930 [Halomicroarcula sp. GCM10025894]|uniref:hypothetical protein n=1 Tax=Halomicroarcula sp. GCM10025894 TaxID=3252673 RepID=UPI00360AB3C6
MTREILAIGPRSPPITGPGLKNRYIQAGLEGHGLDVHWVNTLETRPKTVAELLSKTLSYDAYILSASTKVRLGVAPCSRRNSGRRTSTARCSRRAASSQTSCGRFRVQSVGSTAGRSPRSTGSTPRPTS